MRQMATDLHTVIQQQATQAGALKAAVAVLPANPLFRKSGSKTMTG